MRTALLMKKIIVILFFLFGLLALLKAQARRQLNEIVVEAKAETNALEEQKKAIPAKIVIGAKDLRNFGNHTVGDVLKRLPRIVMQGPPAFHRNIMMGGLDKQFQSVLINGNRPAGGEDYRDFKLDRIPVNMVEEIEIIFNPPAQWGGDAAMGVVNIKLKEAPEKQILNANIDFNHTSTREGLNPGLFFTYGDNYGKLSFITGYSLKQFGRENSTTLADKDIRGTEDETLDVKIAAFNGSMNYTINESNKLKFETFFSNYTEDLDFIADVKRRSDGRLNFTADTAADKKLRRLHSQRLSYETKGEAWKWTNALHIAQNFDEKDRWRMTAKTSGLMETWEDEDQQNTEMVFRSDYQLNFHRHKLKIGVRASGLWRDYMRMAYSRIAGRKFWDEITDGSYTLDEYRLGAYASDEMNFGKLFVLPSLGFDYDTRSYDALDETGGFRYVSVNPALHTKYLFSENFALKADVARQISRPPFNAQVPIDKIKHKKSTIERGNSELKPSLAYNYSGGVEKFFAGSGYVTLRGYYSVMRDLIETKNLGVDPDYGYQLIQSVNVDSGLVWGIDLDARYKLLQHRHNELSLAGNISWLGSEVRDAATGELRRLNEQAQWTSNVALDYLNTRLKFQFSVGMNHLGKRYIAGGSDDGTPIASLVYQPFTQWDARVKYFFRPWGSIFINAVNLFDEVLAIKQAGVSETEVVGRNMRVGLNFTL